MKGTDFYTDSGAMMFGLVFGSASIGGPCEQLLAVRENHIFGVRFVRLGPGEPTGDRDFSTDRKRLFLPSTPIERIRRTELERPILNLAVRRLDVDVQPPMRIDPVHLRD